MDKPRAIPPVPFGSRDIPWLSGLADRALLGPGHPGEPELAWVITASLEAP